MRFPFDSRLPCFPSPHFTTGLDGCLFVELRFLPKNTGKLCLSARIRAPRGLIYPQLFDCFSLTNEYPSNPAVMGCWETGTMAADWKPHCFTPTVWIDCSVCRWESILLFFVFWMNCSFKKPTRCALTFLNLTK